VGLALSGGGARGLAHVGALEVLERERIRIDCVTGTSMGAALGALWASGYSAARINEVVRSIDWEEVFSGRRVRSLIPLSRRIDDVPPALRVGLEGVKPRLPRSRDSDYRLNRLLFKLLAEPGLRAGGDFGRLQVPFRAVATDVANVERVVLASGSLPRSVRASMSTPVSLPPVTLDDRQLVDGGIGENVPVRLAREMGADVVIAVDASSPPLTPDEYRDLYGIGVQLVDALMRDRGAYRADAEVLIRPELGLHKFDDYTGTDMLIGAGRTAAEQAVERLRALARDSSARPAEPAEAAARTVRSVEIRGQRYVSEGTLRSAFAVREGQTFQVESVLRGLDRLWALGLFETVWVDAKSAGDGVGLAVEVGEAPGLFAELGLAYDEADQASGLVRLRHRNALGHAEQLDAELLGGEREAGARLTFSAGARWGAPLGFVIGGQLLEERPVVYRRGDGIGRAEFSRNFAFGALRVAVGGDVLAQAGLAVGRLDSDFRPGLALPVQADDYRMINGMLAWDRLDDRDMPESGAALVLRGERSLEGLGADRDYWRAQGTARAAAKLARGFVVEASAFLGLSGRDVPVYDLYRIGGPGFLPGRPRDELWGRQALGLSLAPGFDMRGFRISLRAGAGNVWGDRSAVSLSDLRSGVGIALARRTRMGPISIDAGLDEDGEGALYVSIGRRARFP
jgi:NTE family protein